MSEEEILKECNKLFVTMVNCHINGKPMADLLALYEQEKEKTPESVRKQFETYQNRICELEEKLKIATAMLTRGTYPEKNKGDNDFDKQFIAIEKIKEIVEKSFDEMLNHSNKFNCGDMQMLENNIVELLEEEKENV